MRSSAASHVAVIGLAGIWGHRHACAFLISAPSIAAHSVHAKRPAIVKRKRHREGLRFPRLAKDRALRIVRECWESLPSRNAQLQAQLAACQTCSR